MFDSSQMLPSSADHAAGKERCHGSRSPGQPRRGKSVVELEQARRDAAVERRCGTSARGLCLLELELEGALWGEVAVGNAVAALAVEAALSNACLLSCSRATGAARVGNDGLCGDARSCDDAVPRNWLDEICSGRCNPRSLGPCTWRALASQSPATPPLRRHRLLWLHSFLQFRRAAGGIGISETSQIHPRVMKALHRDITTLLAHALHLNSDHMTHASSAASRHYSTSLIDRHASPTSHACQL